MANEADTCRQYVVPKLQAAGWDDEPHRLSEQVTFTDGRIVVTGRLTRRRPGKRADYILRCRPDFAIAVVEAKPGYKTPGEGLQQAKDYTAEKVRTLFRSAADLRRTWADPAGRAEVIAKLTERGIDFDELATASNQPDADPFDLLCHVAFNAPLRTRRERAQRLRSERKDFFDRYGPKARAILDELLNKYTEHGTAQFVIPDALEVPPVNRHGNVIEIARHFGGEDKLVEAMGQLQMLLYAA